MQAIVFYFLPPQGYNLSFLILFVPLQIPLHNISLHFQREIDGLMRVKYDINMASPFLVPSPVVEAYLHTGGWAVHR